MKFLASLAFFAATTQATVITVISPWSTTVWQSGGAGLVTWNSTAGGGPDFTTCSIDLLNGDPKAANLVAHITSQPVAVSLGKFQITPIQDFATGSTYWIRIGNSGQWFYSGTFSFQGKGTVPPLSAAWSPSASAGASGVSGVSSPTSGSANNPLTASSAAASASSSLQASISAAAAKSDAPAMPGAWTAVVLSAMGAAVVAMML